MKLYGDPWSFTELPSGVERKFCNEISAGSEDRQELGGTSGLTATERSRADDEQQPVKD